MKEVVVVKVVAKLETRDDNGNDQDTIVSLQDGQDTDRIYIIKSQDICITVILMNFILEGNLSLIQKGNNNINKRNEGQELKEMASIPEQKRILLVDDEPDLCMLYQIILHEAGYICDAYKDPIKALQEFKSDYYDLIMLDVKMPKLNGLELCNKIREIDRDVPVSFITASQPFVQIMEYSKYSSLSNIHYIQKPITNEDLAKRVEELINKEIKTI